MAEGRRETKEGLVGPVMIRAHIKGTELRFETSCKLFSPARPDRGSLAMLSEIIFEHRDKILDLGCGYGLMGIYAAKLVGPERVWMLDNDQTAIDSALKNVLLNQVVGVTVRLSDGFRDLSEAGFDKIVCNPPYHADFSVPKHFIEKGFKSWAAGSTS
jgi:16S rRNA (guanine1207-N2)-methyltransferase